MKIILATRNPSKSDQIRAIFADLPVEIVNLDQAGIIGEAIEDGISLQENALKKAHYAYDQSAEKTFAMADDTGLFINALGGKPGIHAARWAGENAATEEITRHTLDALKGVTDRTATFKTAVALITPDGNQYFFEGQVKGRLLESPRGKPQTKMPYSGIFVCDGSEQVWAEMSVEYENSISHRGKAFKGAHDFIANILENR